MHRNNCSSSADAAAAAAGLTVTCAAGIIIFTSLARPAVKSIEKKNGGRLSVDVKEDNLGIVQFITAAAVVENRCLIIAKCNTHKVVVVVVRVCTYVVDIGERKT